MRLTQKQENFCVEFVKCGNAAEAYRRSYNASKMQDVSVWNASSRLMSDDKIAARIQNLRDSAAKKAQVTLEGHLEDLKRLRDQSVESGQFSAAIAAEISLGKAVGLYTDKVQADVKQDVKVVLFGGD